MDEKKLGGLTLEQKRAIIVKEDDSRLSARQQCEFLGLNRSSLYCEPAPISESDIQLMNVIDEVFTKKPYLGVRQIMWRLRDRGFRIGRKKVRTPMRRMGLFPIFPKRNTSKRNPEHPVYPYLLRDVTVERVNQIWSIDITYIRLGKGFAYLTAIMDWQSRYVIAWRMSNTLTADFCVECLKEALEYGGPEIFNTDQGCQFTSVEFIRVLEGANIAISMDGKGRTIDNIFVERLWRTVKYEDVYIKQYQTIPEATEGLKEFFDDCNMERRHSSLGFRTPWSVFSGVDLSDWMTAAHRKH